MKRVIDSFVAKISSAETRPLVYWDRKWQLLRGAWLEARRAYEAEAITFRPLPDNIKLSALKASEEVACAAVEAFLVEERQGLHP